MFGKIAGFEFRYQIRQPVFWVVAILFFLLTFLATTIDQVRIGSGGNVLKNSAFAIGQTHLILTIFYMFVTTAFVANVIVRDVETGFGPIVHATRMNKFDYLYGRFAGAFAAVALSFLAVPLAMMTGALMPWLDPETVGPLNLQHYAYAYFWLALPGLFLTSALFFALATVTRSMMATYVGVVGVFVAYFVLNVSLDRPELETVRAYAEPFGIAAYGEATEYWTATERNTLTPAFEGAILWGRLLWIGVAAVILCAAYVLFRVETKGKKAKKQQKLQALAEASPTPPAPIGPLPKPTYGAATARVQLWARTKFEMGHVFKSPAYFVLLALGLFNAGGALWRANELYGTQFYPVTRTVIETLTGAFSIIPVIVAIYYAGELVWRERERRTAETVDATAVPDWAFVLPKTLAIALVLLSTLLVSVAAGVLAQALRGYPDFEFDKYLLWYVLPQTVDWTLIAILAVFIQVLSPHKFVGWGVMLVYFISTFALAQIGAEHMLYNYASSPPLPTSDMNGLGGFWKGAIWMRVYWLAFATLMVVVAYGLWRRGTETRLAPRLARLPRRLKGAPGVIAAVAALVFVGTGAYAYVNTNVWNDYVTSQDMDRWLADYEKALLRYEKTPQPTITAVKLDLDLHPHAPRLKTRGSYVIENQTAAPISELHLRAPDPFIEMSYTVPGARVKRDYERFKYRIYAFATPMQPGEKRTISFESLIERRGFANGDPLTRVVDNGTFITNGEFAPYIGIDRSGMLQERAKRNKYGLPRELRVPARGTPGADAHNYLRHDSGYVDADITITTVADQTPIAPGQKVSDRTAGGRRTARFVSESPIMNFFSIQSARYAVKTEQHNGVQIAVYYDERHPRNIDRMINAAKASLDYYTANFSPYQFKQLRFIEFPYGSYAQAFPATMAWSENLGFIADIRDPSKIDYVTYVGAHEIAHQWWAHQLIGADEQGMTSTSETLAQYSALMVMEKLYGPDQIRKFLKYELDRYLGARGSDPLGEQPLGRVENQQYIHYQKGSLAMYLLKDMMGEDKVNAALRELLSRYAFKNAPYPRSTELVAALRRQAGDDAELQQLITDLFENITLYDLKAKGATVRKRADGAYDVTVSIESRKLYADPKGKETQAPLDEHFDIGLFTAEPGKKGFTSRNVVLFERRPLKGGVETFTFRTDRAPVWVGVDPYNKRIDRNSDDNVIRVGGAALGAR